MTTELIPASNDAQEAAALALTKASDYLPRLQLFSSKSGPCTEGLIPIGHYGLVEGESIDDLGDEISILICAGRPKALQIADDNIFTSFDEKSELFARIREESAVKDSGCMYGPEYLIWEPENGVFATFFMGSKTMRKESKSVQARVRQLCTLTSVLIKKPKYTWHGPKASDCTTEFDIPELAVIQKAIDKFKAEKGTAIKAVAADSKTRDV